MSDKAEQNKWLRQGDLIYRLAEDNRGRLVNCDEISVTMANGSRELSDRGEKAKEIKAMMDNHYKLVEALEALADFIKLDAISNHDDYAVVPLNNTALIRAIEALAEVKS